MSTPPIDETIVTGMLNYEPLAFLLAETKSAIHRSCFDVKQLRGGYDNKDPKHLQAFYAESERSDRELFTAVYGEDAAQQLLQLPISDQLRTQRRGFAHFKLGMREARIEQNSLPRAVLEERAAAIFADKYKSYPGEVLEALKRVVAIDIISRREKILPEMEAYGYTRKQLQESSASTSYIAAVASYFSDLTTDPPEEPQPLPDGIIDFADVFADDRLEHSIYTGTQHLIAALKAAGREWEVRGYAAIAKAIAQKWDAEPGRVQDTNELTIKEGRRPPYPQYKAYLTDNVTLVLFDNDNNDHATLFATGEVKVPFSKKPKTAVTVKLKNFKTGEGEYLPEIPPQDVPILKTLISLADTVKQQGGTEDDLCWPLDYVARNMKEGGSAFGTTYTSAKKGKVITSRITEAEREATWAAIKSAGLLSVIIDWQKAAELKGLNQYAPIDGAIISPKREPRIIDGVVTDCVRLLEWPVLGIFAEGVGQIVRYPAALTVTGQHKRLQASAKETKKPAKSSGKSSSSKERRNRKTPRKAALKFYLEDRIVRMKRSPNLSRTIVLKSAWNRCRETKGPESTWKEWGDLSRTEQKRFRDDAAAFLEAYKANGFIEDYQIVKGPNGSLSKFELTVKAEKGPRRQTAGRRNGSGKRGGKQA